MTEVYLAADAFTVVLEIIVLLPILENTNFYLSLQWYSKVAKNNNDKLVQMNSVIRKNLNTIEQNYSKRRHKSTECVTNHRVL